MGFGLCFSFIIVLFISIQIIERYTVNKLFKNGDYEKLESRFKRIISGARSNAVIAYAYQNLVIIYMETNRYNDAHECITKVKELGFHNSVILSINESTLLIKECRYNEAETMINNCLKDKHLSKQHEVLLKNNLADIMIHTNRINDAKNTLDNLLSENPTNAVLLVTLGDLYMIQNNVSNAKEVYVKSLQYNKNNYSLVQHVRNQLNLINTKS